MHHSYYYRPLQSPHFHLTPTNDYLCRGTLAQAQGQSPVCGNCTGAHSCALFPVRPRSDPQTNQALESRQRGSAGGEEWGGKRVQERKSRGRASVFRIASPRWRQACLGTQVIVAARVPGGARVTCGSKGARGRPSHKAPPKQLSRRGPTNIQNGGNYPYKQKDTW